MLVVVEDRNIEPVPQGILDVEALRGFDVLQVDTPHGGSKHLAEPNDVLGVGSVDFEVEDVDVGEPLEKNRLAFHHRLTGQGPDIAETEHCAAVGDHRHQVAPIGVSEGRLRVVGDDQTGLGHAGRVGETEVRL